MSQPASGFLEMLGSVAQALSPFKVRAPPKTVGAVAVAVAYTLPVQLYAYTEEDANGGHRGHL